MATSTFSGPLRSESTFKVVSKDPATGTIAEVSTLGGVPVSLADGNVTLTNADHSGRVLLVPDGTQDNTYTLPAPVPGAMFTFVYAGGAADATDFIINTGANANFFIGGVSFDNTGTAGASVAFSDGNSNSKFQVNVPGAAQVTVMALDATNWQIWGTVVAAATPAFADQ
jgi:hypothetical protein|tara:strand:- start:426 stop:935 length:510 start_codon:yes stop_codon:yes gene_type:complete